MGQHGANTLRITPTRLGADNTSDDNGLIRALGLVVYSE